MAGSGAEVNLRTVAFPDLLLGLPPPQLPFDNGNVLIKLSDDVRDQLLLPQSILSKASLRYRTRFGSSYFCGGREILHPITEQTVTVFEYRLTLVDDTFSLTDEGEKQVERPTLRETGSVRGARGRRGGRGGAQVRDSRISSFQTSELADQAYHSHSPYSGLNRGNSDYIRSHAVLAHKIAFTLLFNQPFESEMLEEGQELFTMIEVAALADYYDFLSSIAGRITSLMEGVPGFWKDVAEKPTFYLRFSIKIRAETIFGDALRHLIGRLANVGYRTNSNYHNSYDYTIPYPEEATAIILQKTTLLQERMQNATHELRGHALYEYQAGAWKVKKQRGPKVRTTWLANGLADKDLNGVCRSIANSVYREILDQKIFGEGHWSHVRQAETDPPDGQVTGGSLRIACKSITDAHDNPESARIFGKSVAERYTNIFMLPRKATNMIAGHLKALVRNANQSINHWFPAKDGYKVAGDYCEWSRAKVDTGLDYFTLLPVEEEDLPWFEQTEWEELEPMKLEAASEAWLEAVGVEC